jgi:hypothetical protein
MELLFQDQPVLVIRYIFELLVYLFDSYSLVNNYVVSLIFALAFDIQLHNQKVYLLCSFVLD